MLRPLRCAVTLARACVLAKNSPVATWTNRDRRAPAAPSAHACGPRRSSTVYAHQGNRPRSSLPDRHHRVSATRLHSACRVAPTNHVRVANSTSPGRTPRGIQRAAAVHCGVASAMHRLSREHAVWPSHSHEQCTSAHVPVQNCARRAIKRQVKHLARAVVPTLTARGCSPSAH